MAQREADSHGYLVTQWSKSVYTHRTGASSFQGEVPAPKSTWVAGLASPAEPLPQGKVASYPQLWLLFLAWPDAAI